MNTRRTLIHATALLAVATLAGLAPAARAQEFPSKPVTIYTAFAPGSGPDAVLRLVAEKLGKTWKQRVLVENRPGGGGFLRGAGGTQGRARCPARPPQRRCGRSLGRA